MGRVILTKEQAISALKPGDRIHTFLSGGMIMIGADWDRKDALEAIEQSKLIELSGDNARAMGHGLCMLHNGRYYFVESNEQVLAEIEAKCLDDEAPGIGDA